jgi:hypothetical protein
MAVAAIGLTPILPTIDVTPVVDIPVADNMVKLLAVRRLTGAKSMSTIGLAANWLDDTDGSGEGFELFLLHPIVKTAASNTKDQTAFNGLKKPGI